MIAWFAAWLQATGLFVLKEVDQFRYGGLFHTKTFVTRMPRSPVSMASALADLRGLIRGFNLNQTVLYFIKDSTHRGKL